MRWLALLILVPSVSGAITVSDVTSPEWLWPGQAEQISLTVTIDCSDMPSRAPEGKNVLHVTAVGDGVVSYMPPTAHTIDMPPGQCASTDAQYSWSPTLTVVAAHSAIGLIEHEGTLIAWIDNGTVDPVPAGPKSLKLTHAIYYVGDVSLTLNGTIDPANDGSGAISIWVENLSNADTDVAFKLREFNGDGELGMADAMRLDSPLLGTMTGGWATFTFEAPAEWSGHSEYTIEVTPAASDDAKHTGAIETIDLVFDKDGTGAWVTDNKPKPPSQGTPGLPLVATLATLAAIALAWRRR